ncbi:MAG: ATP-binding protein [Bacteroidales bacterium]|nr:ATP-binding protein [Bacteroidales bacterium]
MTQTSDILLQVLRNIPDILILLIDKQGIILTAEGREKSKLGLNNKRVAGKKFSGIFSPVIYKSLKALQEVSAGGTTISHEMMIRDQYYYIQALPLYDEAGDSFFASLMVFENMTEYKLNADRLSIAREVADRSNRAKTIFLANMSHEIRTPLNTIIGFTEQLKKTKLTKKQSQFLEIVKSSSDHLLSMVSRIITLSEVDTGEVNFDRKPFLIGDVMNEVIKMESDRAQKKGIELNKVWSTRLDIPLFGDEVSLTQILLNLLNNAIKFTNEGSVLLSAEVKDETKQKIIVVFRVIDTGIGIPEDKLRLVFEDFTQADAGVSATYGGSGLGLTIANKLVVLQGGSIEVNSDEGEGTEFIVTIPYDKANGSNRIQKKRKEVNSEVLEGLSFLYVDDDENNRLLCKVIFDDWKVDYDIVDNGARALSLAQKKEYDVILIDIRMPGMDGLEVSRHLRRIYEEREGQYRLIAVTANAIKRDIEGYLKAGMHGILLKPFRELDLFDAILRYLLDDTEPAGDYYAKQFAGGDSTDENILTYDLSDLREASRNNRTFINKMIDTFITNASQNLIMMNHELESKDWNGVGELAHKMLPSYRHLRIYKLVNLLEHIEEHTLRKKQHKGIKGKVNTLQHDSLLIFEELKNERK